MIGQADPFRAVADWDEQTAATWAAALDTRAAGSDQVRLRSRLCELSGLRPGGRALEIGCGTGHLLLGLAAAVGDGDDGVRRGEVEPGSVVGIEPQQLLADQARRRTADVPGVVVHTASADRLPVADAGVDACVAQTVLIHLPPPVLDGCLREACRVLVPGGRLVSADQDGDSWVIDHPDRRTTRKIVEFNSDQRYADGWTGRRLPRLFREHGLRDVTVETLTHLDTRPGSYLYGMALRLARAAEQAGAVDPGAGERWITELEEQAAGGAFLASITYFLAAGVR